MNTIRHKLHNRAQRKNRIRSVISGTAKRPRLTVTVSNLHVSAQLIDDTSDKTIASATTVGQKATGSLTEKAAQVGEAIAAQAKAAKVKQVVFDRNGKLYHGRVKALADAARNAGLEF
jgi:large subunit ribosomal protein L18